MVPPKPLGPLRLSVRLCGCSVRKWDFKWVCFGAYGTPDATLRCACRALGRPTHVITQIMTLATALLAEPDFSSTRLAKTFTSPSPSQDWAR